jgi:hypothetical protein
MKVAERLLDAATWAAWVFVFWAIVLIIGDYT